MHKKNTCSADGYDSANPLVEGDIAQKEEADTCKDQKLTVQTDCSLCFTFIVLAGIAVNALVVGLIIFAQPRYMIYGMAFSIQRGVCCRML